MLVGGKKGNFNKISFANTYVVSTFSIVLKDSKFIKDYKEKLSQWNEYQTKIALT
jgi:hypothetical protein